MSRSIELLEALTQADGVPGFEGAVRDVFTRELEGSGEITTDRMGGVVCKRTGTSEGPRVMLDCHLDEVGFIVQHITPKGFLRFLPLGGWWTHLLPAQRVRVYGHGEPVLGVVGSIPPHFLPEDRRQQLLPMKELFIDVGAKDADEVASLGIRPGSWAVPVSPFTRLANERLLLSKAFDNRVGCALAIETARDATEHPNTIYAVGSAQEEVGLRGTRATVSMVQPDVAIVLEGTPADDTPGFSPDESQATLGRGPQIRAYDPSMIANPKLVELALETARAENIELQVAVRAAGGTNAGQIHLHGAGVPTAVVAVPSRYIHAHTSIIDIGDYEGARRLVAALVKRLDAETVRSLT